MIEWHEYEGPGGSDWFDESTRQQRRFLEALLLTLATLAGEPVPPTMSAVCDMIEDAYLGLIG